jgi:hypothetical protein
VSEPAEASLASYQYAVRKLTAENKELRQQLTAAKVAHQREARRLRAQRDEGLTPEIAALRRQLRHWRERAVAAEGRLANVKRSVA